MIEKIFAVIEAVWLVVVGLLAICISVLSQFSVMSAAAEGWYDTVDWQFAIILPLIPLLGVMVGTMMILISFRVRR